MTKSDNASMINFHLKRSTGKAVPFGVSRIKTAFNFSIFSPNAKKVILNIFDQKNRLPIAQYHLDPEKNRTGTVWHIGISGLPDHFLYTYQIHGITNEKKGELFFPDHHLIDPYAKSIFGLQKWGRSKKKAANNLFSEFFESSFDWENDRPLNKPWHQLIIYELHTRSFTMTAPVKFPGTFAGLIEKIDYLKELGITAVELLPVHEFDETDCPFYHPETGEQLLSTWGYSSLNFFAIRSAYGSQSGERHVIDEFKEMVKQFHQAGIEVIIDVVFNHSSERDKTGPVFNFKGIANTVYYMLDQAGDYLNYSGCGNTLNCNHPAVIQMILDALRYWVTEMHVDGFRFDLAAILTRGSDGKVLSDPPVVSAIAKDPVLAKTKIIAEAWDAVGLYQVGCFPAYGRWAEWNGQYRDVIRRFCLGIPGITGETASRLSGSEDIYGASGRKPYHSINFITAHDGFTMLDLVSYREKHNLANGENNRDGGNDNFSQNFGQEGSTDDPVISKQRRQQIYNYITLLMISQGTPMMLAGDEFGNSQNGNNNAWCQDNDTLWLDWSLLEKNGDIFRFWQKMIEFRKSNTAFQRDTYFTGKIQKYDKADISWHNTKLHQPEFGKPVSTLAFHIAGNTDKDIYVIINYSQYDLKFELPDMELAYWNKTVDTHLQSPFLEHPTALKRETMVSASSIQIFILP